MNQLKFVIKSVVILSCLTSCGEEEKDKYGQGIFDFDSTAIVNESTPSQLQTAAALTQSTPDEITQLRDRLYVTEAANSIPNMIESFQARVDELNERTAGYDIDAVPVCINETATDETITTPDGKSFDFKVQCYEELSEGTFMIWGKDDAGVSYIYERGTVTASVVKVTPVDDNSSIFNGYLSLFSETPNEAGTIVHIVANQSTTTVQANLVASHEVCGVSMFASKEKIHFRGSISTGTANSCPEEGDFVFNAADLSASTGFDESLLFDDDFFMKRTAGNKLVNGSVQEYEEYENTSGAGNVTLSYNADPTVSDTDVNFGPSTASALGGKEYISQ